MSQRSHLVHQTELRKATEGVRNERVAADLVTREPRAIEQEHAPASPRETNRGGRSRGARANDDDVPACVGNL
jgi:hypothetical protein